MYRTQRDAERDARIALWGDVHIAHRPCLYPERGTYSIVVAADVNGRTVAFFFDKYGRRDKGPLPT